MSITHSSVTFSGRAGTIVAASAPESQLIKGEYWGLIGESHLLGETFGRDLSCEFTFYGYASMALLATAVAAVEGYTNKLTGTLTQTVNGSAQAYPSCTFLGFEPTEPPFLDGSGCEGWIQRGRLKWRQRSLL